MDVYPLKHTSYDYMSLIKIGTRYGYRIINSKVIQEMSTLTAKYSPDSEILDEIYRINSDDRGLRYDLTVPLCSIFHSQDPRPAKRIDFGPVFRNGPVTSYRSKEFIQFDYDRTYSPGDYRSALVEILSILSDVLELSCENFTVKINSQVTLSSSMSLLEIKSDEAPVVLRTIDKLSKKSLGEIVSDNPNTNVSLISALLQVLNSAVEPDDFRLAHDLLKKDNVIVEYTPTLVRGLDFYTGLFFEVFHRQNTQASLMSGGFYDLSKIRGGVSTPCIGFSIGLNRFSLMLKQKQYSRLNIVFDSTTVDSTEIRDFLNLLHNPESELSLVLSDYTQYNILVKTSKEIRKIRAPVLVFTQSPLFKTITGFYQIRPCCFILRK
jgi:histidyl-tRNA synthetase